MSTSRRGGRVAGTAMAVVLVLGNLAACGQKGPLSPLPAAAAAPAAAASPVMR